MIKLLTFPEEEAKAQRVKLLGFFGQFEGHHQRFYNNLEVTLLLSLWLNKCTGDGRRGHSKAWCSKSTFCNGFCAAYM